MKTLLYILLPFAFYFWFAFLFSHPEILLVILAIAATNSVLD